MLRNIIKYHIIDKCVDIFFTNIINSFSSFSFTPLIEVGNTYKSIRIKVQFYNGKVDTIVFNNVHIDDKVGGIYPSTCYGSYITIKKKNSSIRILEKPISIYIDPLEIIQVT
jgi:hypothetical protein